jgi:AmmeMemoRadiSam system protein A
MKDFTLSNQEKIYLLDLARNTIKSALSKDSIKVPPIISDSLNMSLGVFVTLHKNNQLRGCIGYVTGIKDLKQSVEEMAKAAAFDDPRFPAVENGEIDDLNIEISVLSPLQTVNNIEEIEVGKHGLIIEQNLRRGLLLPQVALEYGWDRLTLLNQTCQKAGLEPNAWKETDSKIQTFTAEIFSENDYR